MSRFYKIIFTTLITCVAFPTSVCGSSWDFASEYKSGYAVPQSPAFILLGSDPSNILRPATVRRLAIEMSSFVNNSGNFSLPREFGIEFSPALLIKGRSLTLIDYQNAPIPYRMRLSFATQRIPETNSASKIAIGFRVALIDDADMRSSKNARILLDAVREKVKEVHDIEQKVKKRIWKSGEYAPGDSIPANVMEEEYTKEERQKVKSLNKRIQNRFKEFQEEYWNAEILELALGWSGTSQDSLGHKPKGGGLVVWGTYGLGVGKHGQWLIGTMFGGKRDKADKMRAFSDLSTRFYFGSNEMKVFAEVGANFTEQHKPNWLLQGGGDIRGPWDTWLDFSVGVNFENGDDKARLVSNIMLKVGTPE